MVGGPKCRHHTSIPGPYWARLNPVIQSYLGFDSEARECRRRGGSKSRRNLGGLFLGMNEQGKEVNVVWGPRMTVTPIYIDQGGMPKIVMAAVMPMYSVIRAN